MLDETEESREGFLQYRQVWLQVMTGLDESVDPSDLPSKDIPNGMSNWTRGVLSSSDASEDASDLPSGNLSNRYLASRYPS